MLSRTRLYTLLHSSVKRKAEQQLDADTFLFEFAEHVVNNPTIAKAFFSTLSVNDIGNLQRSSPIFRHILIDAAKQGLPFLKLDRNQSISLWNKKFIIDGVNLLPIIHTLDLSGTSVTDVSALGNVHTLNLRRTNVSNEDIDKYLKNVKVLTLPNGKKRQ